MRVPPAFVFIFNSGKRAYISIGVREKDEPRSLLLADLSLGDTFSGHFNGLSHCPLNKIGVVSIK
jgi:hypothetical protein